jgi:hypothetical protein
MPCLKGRFIWACREERLRGSHLQALRRESSLFTIHGLFRIAEKVASLLDVKDEIHNGDMFYRLWLNL